MNSIGSRICSAFVAGRQHKPLRGATGSGGEAKTASQHQFNFFPSFLLDRNGKWGFLLLALLVILPVALRASDGRPNLVWQADLQGIHDLVVQGDRVTVESKSGPVPTNVIYRFVTPLPAEDMEITVEPVSSRGYVHVLEQPSLSNGYTLRVRIEDRQDGLFPNRIFISWNGSERMTPKALAVMDHKNKHNAHAPEDKVWVVDGKAEKITCGSVWRGNVHGTARLAFREDGVHVISGNAAGEMEKQAAAKPLKSAHSAAALALPAGVSAKVVEAPTAKNDYTLLVDVTGDTGLALVELAW
jgi:hypothetical protein